jgi:methionine sulfoxide reductase heme-binding subunit
VTTQLWWHVARATGVVAWALLASSVIVGLLLSTRLTRGRPTPAWLTDMHRFLGGTAVAFTLLHVGGLVADTYVHFGLADLLVPFASSWRPDAVALGVVSLYLLAAIELTSLLRRRIPRSVWRRVHLTSFVLFWTATFHFLLAGSDSGHPLARWGINITAATVVFLSLVRILGQRGRSGQPGARHGVSSSSRVGAATRTGTATGARRSRVPV